MSHVQGKPTFTRYGTQNAPMGIFNPELYIVYIRVSTARQGESQLGQMAQAEAVNAFFATRPHDVIATYTEVESGKRSDRPELLKALAECKKRKATLVIAKLDRLGRNLAFIANLMEAGVDFVCCDNPHANRLMLHMLAAFAEFERELISKRTKDALAVAKAKGVQLGTNGKRLAAKHRDEARLRDQQPYPLIASLMHELRSYRAVAERMNALAIRTPTGSRWYASSVRNVCLRAL